MATGKREGNPGGNAGSGTALFPYPPKIAIGVATAHLNQPPAPVRGAQ